jgi:hypothetical protein
MRQQSLIKYTNAISSFPLRIASALTSIAINHHLHNHQYLLLMSRPPIDAHTQSTTAITAYAPLLAAIQTATAPAQGDRRAYFNNSSEHSSSATKKNHKANARGTT